jgi:hypothetical protein
MANGGVDLYLESLRGLGTSASELGDDIVTAKKITAEKDEVERKKEAERLRQERLQGVADAVPELNEKIKDPNYTREDFAADTQDFVQEAIKAGDTNSLQSLQFYKDIFDSRDKLDLADKSETPAERRAARAAEREANKKDKQESDLKGAAVHAGDKLVQTTQSYKDAIEAGEDAGNLIELSKKQPAARGAAVRRLARAAGDKGVLSDKDVDSFGGSDALTARMERIYETAVSGTMTDDDAKYLKDVADKINAVSKERLESHKDTEVKRFTKVWGGDYAQNYERLTGEAPPVKDKDGKTVVAKGKDKPAEDKNSELTDGAGGKDEKLQIVTLDAYQKIREKKAPKFKEGITKLNAWRAAQNPPLPPVTGAELRRSELEIAKRMKIQVSPDVEKSVIGGN